MAEGYGRRYRGEYVRFLNIAQGSVNELETHLILSKRVGLCSEKDIEVILNLLREESRMIISLIKRLENLNLFPVKSSLFPPLNLSV
ncbi:four helix bundle protein [Anabaena sphaerica]